MDEPIPAAPEYVASLTVGEVVSNTFNILGRGFFKLATLVVLGNILIWVGSLFWASRLMNIYDLMDSMRTMEDPTFTDVFTSSDILALSLIMLVAIVLSIWMNGAIVHMASVIHFGGTPSLGASVKRATKRLGRMLGTYLLLALIALVPAILLMGMMVSFMALAAPAGFVMVLVVIIIEIYVWVRLGFISQAVFIEDKSMTGSLGRTWNLVADNWWHTFGYLFLLGLIGFAISLIFFFIPIVGELITTFVVTPIGVIGTTLVYLDVRSRQEKYTEQDIIAALDTEDKEPGLI